MTALHSLPAEVIWPLNALHQALPLLTRVSSLLPTDTGDALEPFAEGESSEEVINHWLTATARQIGLEFQAVETSYPEVENMLTQAGPAVLHVPGTASPCFLIIIAGGRRIIRLLKQDGSLLRLPLVKVRDALTAELETPVLPPIENMLEQIGIQTSRREKVRRALLREHLAVARISGCHILRQPSGTSFIRQLRQVGFAKRLLALFLATVADRLLLLGAAFMVGRTVLQQGGIELRDLQLWGLLLLTAIPVQLLALKIKNRLSLHFGAQLRSRLLCGILQLRPEEIRLQGSGHFIGNVQEIEQLEALGIGMALAACIAGIEVLVAAGVLLLGAGGLLHALLLLAWIGGIILLARVYYQRMQDWLLHYRLMTCDLVERMAGHRTRLAQEIPTNRHNEEDRLLSRYAYLSKKLDTIQVMMESLAGRRGWLPISLLSMLMLFFTTGTDITLLAVSLGGTLLAALSLEQLTGSIHQFLEALMSWHQVHPLYEAAAREHAKKTPKFISPTFLQQQAARHPIIRAEKINFSYNTDGRGRKRILDKCSLTLESGQHFLLEGPSGGGKSTLAALLSGLEVPESGSLLLLGLSHERLGEELWRKRVVIAPQFHQNYVLSETFAFNLLMGRSWPPTHKDLLEAEKICQELGLGELLETMPAGLQQMVGESGWRLSHGEQSRLFIARTLLQQTDLVILDESFAALDPETLTIALSCVLRRADALLLIAHP